jgi:hypothetical protein
MTTIEVVYRAKPKSPIKATDVQSVGRELEAIGARNGQSLDAEMVLQAAKEPASTLHKYFEWDDTEAARQYRLEQARLIVRSIEVRIVTRSGPNPEFTWTRKYHHVRMVERQDGEPEVPASPGGPDTDEDNATVGRYVPVEIVVTRPKLLDQVVGNAYEQMVGWRDRYRTYRRMPEFAQFAAVFDAIDRVERERSAHAEDEAVQAAD